MQFSSYQEPKPLNKCNHTLVYFHNDNKFLDYLPTQIDGNWECIEFKRCKVCVCVCVGGGGLWLAQDSKVDTIWPM